MSTVNQVPRDNPGQGPQDPYNSGPSTPGAPGIGVPAGGLTGQSLVKNSNTDFDTKWQTPSGGGGGSAAPGGRLTLESGVPVSTTDQIGKATIYYTPFRGNQAQLWDGASWTSYTFTEITLALGTLTASLCYDVFARQVAGVVTLDVLAWSSATARATAVTLQDGRYCKSGDKTRLYLGTFYTTSTTTTEDSGGGTTTQVGGKRFLWNYYNRVTRQATVFDSTDTWSYNTATVRQANGIAGNRVDCVVGIAEDSVWARVSASIYLLGGPGWAISGVGIDTGSAFSGQPGGVYNATGGAIAAGFNLGGSYSGILSAGYHSIAWCEKGPGSALTSLWIGDDAGDGQQTGLTASTTG